MCPWIWQVSGSDTVLSNRRSHCCCSSLVTATGKVQFNQPDRILSDLMLNGSEQSLCLLSQVIFQQPLCWTTQRDLLPHRTLKCWRPKQTPSLLSPEGDHWAAWHIFQWSIRMPTTNVCSLLPAKGVLALTGLINHHVFKQSMVSGHFKRSTPSLAGCCI